MSCTEVLKVSSLRLKPFHDNRCLLKIIISKRHDESITGCLRSRKNIYNGFPTDQGLSIHKLSIIGVATRGGALGVVAVGWGGGGPLPFF